MKGCATAPGERDRQLAQEVFLESTDGLRLEGLLESPDRVLGVLALCHPHPQMGGTMNAPLLQALSAGLAAESWVVLRFNFRGIRRSAGESSLGEAEVADAAGALAYLRSQFPGLPSAIAGWSFGAGVAVRTAAADDKLRACVAIAPPIKERPGITEGLPLPVDLELKAKLLVVCGDNDELVSPRDCRTWADYVPGTKHVALPGANHLFWAKYDDLLAVVVDFLDANR